MLNKNSWLLILTFTLVACAAPTVEPLATEPVVTEPAATLPPPAVATLPPTIELKPTDLPAVQPTLAPTLPATEAPTQTPILTLTGTFVTMEVPSSGSFILDPTTNLLTFSNDFLTQRGPDLFVILSSVSDVALDFQSFSNLVVNAPIVYLGELVAVSGPQQYTLPAGTDISQFRTVIVWCKTYSVAFAAALIN